MQGSDVLKLGLVAVGAYFLYEYFYGTPSASTAASTASTNTATTSTSVAVNQATTLNKVMAAVTADNGDVTSYQSVDFWNFYYNQIRGAMSAPGHEILFPGADPNKQYSINEWWGAMMAAGFSGGLGHTIVRVPFTGIEHRNVRYM
jgi:hypothetical protein